MCDGLGWKINDYLLNYRDADINKPIIEERKWDRNPFHYDNVLKAMLTLFVVSTFEVWPG